MNVAEITTYKEGGVYTHVVELVKRMKVTTLCISGNTKKSGYQKENDHLFFHIPTLFSFWEIFFINPPGSYRKIIRLFKKNKIDLVHLHGPLFTFCWGILRSKKLPCVMTTHYILDFKGNKIFSFFYRGIIKWVTLLSASAVDKLICVNNDYLETYVEWGIDPQKLAFIPNGIDTEKYSPGISDIKQKLGCKHLVIYWGRIGYQKNIQLLIKAFQILDNADIKLVIIGKGPDRPMLQKVAKGNENIIFTGYLPHDMLLEYARGADVAALPSRGESWGLVIGEAMACGLPVISSDVGKAGELLGENERGMILEHDTAEELSEKIEYLLTNKETALEMGKKAREHILQTMSWTEVAQKTEQVYEDVLSSHSSIQC